MSLEYSYGPDYWDVVKDKLGDAKVGGQHQPTKQKNRNSSVIFFCPFVVARCACAACSSLLRGMPGPAAQWGQPPPAPPAGCTDTHRWRTSRRRG